MDNKTLSNANGIVAVPANATVDQLKAIIAQQNAALEAKATRKVGIKTSPKGLLQFTGLYGGFPISLYPEHYRTLVAMKDEVEKFIADNHDKLSFKNEKGGLSAEQVEAQALEAKAKFQAKQLGLVK